MSAARVTGADRVRGAAAALRPGIAPALVLAIGLGLVWLPRASGWGIAAGCLGALAGGLAGHALAATRLRSWVVPLGVLAGGGLLLQAFHLAGLAPVPGRAPWPEVAAAVRDAGVLATVSAGVALLAAFFARRVRALRVLPVAILVFAVAALLAPHRGGSINRPHAVADLAWLRGWHPGLLLTIAGTVAGLVAAVGLLRPRRSGPAWFSAAAGLLLALFVIAASPSIGLFRPSAEDPLGLSGRPDKVSGPGGAGGREGPRQQRPREGNPLGLEAPDGGGQGQPPEMVPFQDDYSSDTSQMPIAVVVLHDDVEPASGSLYFRQLAFSAWNGRRLTRAFVPGIDADIFDGFSGGPVAGPTTFTPATADGLRQEVPATISLLRDHVQPPVLADGIGLTPEENADPALFRRTYSTRSHVLVAPPERLFGRRAGDPAWSDEVRRTYLEVPEDPRYRQLAEEILATLRPEYRDDPWARALSVALWLQKNTRYSLRSRHAGATDPTAHYLFGDRIGYCVHLSHAAAFLVRALGVPARVAAGYHYDARDRAGGSALLLRSGDAHAWAEVFLEGVGWVAIDPAPPSLDPPTAAPDLDLQRLLGEMARPHAQRYPRDVQANWRFLTMRQALLATLLFGLTLVGAGHATKAWRRLAPRFLRSDRAARTAYRVSLDRLAEVGLVRQPGETREAFARRAAPLAPSFERLTALHLGARFGRRPSEPGEARRLARAVAGELAARGGRRRWLGLLAPFRWRASR